MENQVENKVDKYIDVLDGVRAVAICLVAWFHIWQQTWITPEAYMKTIKYGSYKFDINLSIEPMVRFGFQFVDLLILLSAFCNFYPYARSILLGEAWPDTKTFYKKRAIRILPSYYLCLIVMLIVATAEGKDLSGNMVWKDILAHFLCVTPLFAKLSFNTIFNGVLWTVQIEVLYYVLIPWIAKLFRRFPICTIVGLWAIGHYAINCVANDESSIAMYINYMPTFAGVYANGFLLCMLYITIKKNIVENKYTKLAATGIFLCCITSLYHMFGFLYGEHLQLNQLQQRTALSVVFSMMLLTLPFSFKGLKMLFANKAMKFIAGISYNLYLWHQYLAVELKLHRIPFWKGDVPPNMTGDTLWMHKYQICILLGVGAVSMTATYFIEKPIARFLGKRLIKPSTIEKKED